MFYKDLIIGIYLVKFEFFKDMYYCIFWYYFEMYFRCIIDGLNLSIVFNGYEFLKEMFYIFINYFVFGKKIWL